MIEKLSKSQVDQLGERLRGSEITPADLQLLDTYRHSFARAYEDVVGTIRVRTGLSATGRPTKSTTSISDKLARESIRLSQMQDIAGCRIVVSDVVSQDTLVEQIKEFFETTVVFDRRERSSHGYRAVHLVVRQFGLPIEIQIRTELQHVWAELSEKLSDVVDTAVKYGGGPFVLQSFLASTSEAGQAIESSERRLHSMKTKNSGALSEQQKILADEIAAIKHELAETLREEIGDPAAWKEV